VEPAWFADDQWQWPGVGGIQVGHLGVDTVMLIISSSRVTKPSKCRISAPW